MNYLERSAHVVESLGGSFPRHKIRKPLGGGNTMQAYAASSISVDGEVIPVAVKRFVKNKHRLPERDREKFVRSLAFVSLVDEALPDLSSLLPRFYALLVNKRGQAIGQITEDFSAGGHRYVSDYSYSWQKRPLAVNAIIDRLTQTVQQHIEPAPQEYTFSLVPNDDYIERCLNHVEGVGPRFVDLYGQPIENDPYSPVRGSEEGARTAAATIIANALRTDHISQDLVRHTVTLQS